MGLFYKIPCTAQGRFQSTHPVRGGTTNSITIRRMKRISIHPPRAGWDYGKSNQQDTDTDFNPPTPCGVGLLQDCSWFYGLDISIHPPRAGWDHRTQNTRGGVVVFQSTHPVRGGTQANQSPRKKLIFQSTHPVRGGTNRLKRRLSPFAFQSTHPVRGGTSMDSVATSVHGNFNPPTPCGVGLPCRHRDAAALRFQSTHPVRGGTGRAKRQLEGVGNFNPPTPCGVGRRFRLISSRSRLFQSTHPVRGGTPTK